MHRRWCTLLPFVDSFEMGIICARPFEPKAYLIRTKVYQIIKRLKRMRQRSRVRVDKRTWKTMDDTLFSGSIQDSHSLEVIWCNLSLILRHLLLK